MYTRRGALVLTFRHRLLQQSEQSRKNNRAQSNAQRKPRTPTCPTRRVKVAQSRPTLCDPMNYSVHGILQARILECLSLLQGIFPTQGSKPGLPHCRRILYQLSHQGSSRIPKVVYPFPEDLPDPGTEPGTTCIAGRFFTS